MIVRAKPPKRATKKRTTAPTPVKTVVSAKHPRKVPRASERLSDDTPASPDLVEFLKKVIRPPE